MKATYSVLYRKQLRESFAYLEDQEGYRYNPEEFCYLKGNINIYITFEPHLVLIQYWLISEPTFTKVPITLLLEFFNENFEPDIDDKASVEETIKIYAEFYRSKIDQIAQRLPDILLPTLKRSFAIGLSITKLALPELLKVNNYRLIYDYIKARDETWIP